LPADPDVTPARDTWKRPLDVGPAGHHTASKAKKTSFESKEVGGIKLAQKSALVSERRHLPKHELAFIGETLATLKQG
jgi:hypothetical protein